MKTTEAVDTMTANVITVKKDVILTEAIPLLPCWHISALPVVDNENKMVGVISEIDLVNLTFDGNAADTIVEEVMVTDIVSFSSNTELADLVPTFSKRHLRRVPIIDKGKVVGIVSRRDILREMLRRYN